MSHDQFIGVVIVGADDAQPNPISLGKNSRPRIRPQGGCQAANVIVMAPKLLNRRHVIAPLCSPMDLTQVLKRRAAWISLVCLLIALLLAFWRAQFDVRREGSGAAGVAQLMGQLSTLQSATPEELEKEVHALQTLGLSRALRHLRFRLEDLQGRTLIQPPPQEEGDERVVFSRVLAALLPANDPVSRSWMLRRQDGRSFRVTLIGNPASERQEAWGNIMGMAMLLLLYSVTLLVGLYWAVRHAFAPIRDILAAVSAWERQDYGRRLPAMPVRELDSIGSALNKLALALETSREHRRQLSLKVQSLQEDERARLARELHDEFAQAITAMRADAAWLVRKLAEPELKAVAEDLGQRCADLHQHMRGVLRQLRPDTGAGEDLALGQLVRDLVQDWQKLPDHGIRYDCRLDLDDRPIPRNLALSIYRLSQEALTNTARHAGPCRVEVSLSARVGENITWQVLDDGAGLEGQDLDQALRRGNGLAGMRERVWAHGGDIEMESGPGMRVAACFPWPDRDGQ
jgi:two-component system sensor histidine kinase UhpB